MKIHFEDLLQEKDSNQSFDISLKLPDLTWQGEPLSFRKPISVSGLIVKRGDILELNANVKSEIILQCGFCLESYSQRLDFSFETRLVKPAVEGILDDRDLDEDNMDAFPYEGSDVDLTRIVQEFLLLELPILRRCKENCKGLCALCGSNLNQEKCKCFNTEDDDSDHLADERLQVLKDFFTTEGEEV
ncbi:MAG: DUF177 domain-containing protein [Clostridia bacterium]|nr:DUF177 domain-containing protein [Clostridia bacterium]